MSNIITESIDHLLSLTNQNGVGVDQAWSTIPCGDGEDTPVALQHGPDGSTEIVVLHDVLATQERARLVPSRARGIVVCATLADLVAHVASRDPADDTSLWLDPATVRLVAVQNGPDRGSRAAGWGDDRATWAGEQSEALKVWLAHDRKPLTQEQFADHLDERARDIIDGKTARAVDLAALVRDLSVHTGQKYSRRVDPVTGLASLTVTTETRNESRVPIPGLFELMIPYFRGDAGTPAMIEVRLSFRIVDGAPVFTYALQRLGDLRDESTERLRGVIAALMAKHPTLATIPLYLGRPADPVTVTR
jgi:uncharacterized protein YfdQ (DUF2303 family)